MTSRQQNTLAMAKASIAVLNNNADIWKANKRVSKAVSDAKAIIAEIDTRNAAGLTQSQGATSQKQDIVNKLAELAAKISKRVKVFAADKNMLDLMQKMSFTKSDYHRMSDADLAAQIRNLLAAASPLVPDLGDYGVDQPLLDQLSRLAAEFKTLESQPRNIIAERKTHNAAIPELIKMLKADLGSIDGLIGIFENQDLEREYKNARIIIDRGIHHKDNTQSNQHLP